jgi:hypothetical protein
MIAPNPGDRTVEAAGRNETRGGCRNERSAWPRPLLVTSGRIGGSLFICREETFDSDFLK